MKPRCGFLKAHFSLLHNGKYAALLENTPLIFSPLQLPGPTLVGLEWNTQLNTHTGWMVKDYFRVCGSAIHQVQSGDSLL